MEQRKDKEKILSAGTLLFVACWAAYCASYLGRINYTAALTAIVADGVFSKSHAGFIGTVYFFCYGAGQIFSGILGDRVSPYKMIGAGLAGTVCANILMPLCSGSYIVMSVVWGLNGIVQSMLWTPILYIISNILPEEQRRRACLYIAASFPVGSLLSYVISAGAIKFASWHFAFFIPAGIIACIFVFWCLAAGKTSKILGRGEKKSLPVQENTGAKVSLGKLFIVSGAAVICVGILVQGMLKDGVVTWVPTMLTEAYTVPASFSLLLTILLPVVNLAGTYASSFVYKRFTKDEIKTAALFYAITLLPLFGLLGIGRISIYTSVLLLAVITTAVHAANSMTITLAPVRFGAYGKSAAVGGILNATVYLGSAVSTGVFGFLADAFGWGPTVCSWLICTVLAVVLCIPSFLQWRQFSRAQ